MRLLPAPFRDDLGRRVPAAVVTEEVLALVEADERRRPSLAGLKRERWRGVALSSVLCGAWVAVTVPLLDTWAPWLMTREDLARFIVIFGIMLAVGFAAPWLHRFIPPMRPRQTRQRLLAALLCPACAHDLKGVPPRDDGVTVCPECGAAWRVEGVEARRHEGTEGKR